MQKKDGVLEIILSLIALTIAMSIFLKAILDMDTNYDVGWYHLPFAARIWNIIPAESFTSGAKVEYRYDGFPLLAHFFQGLLWKLTGRVQAANLVGYLSLIIYILFLRSYLKIPWYISIIAIFTIPAVLTHAPSSFVDLPGNVGASVLMMMTYCFFRQSRLPGKPELLIAFLGAATAANIKPQLQPLVFILFWVVGIRIVWLYWQHTSPSQRQLWLIVPLSAIATAVIFATPIKNVALYGNPFYPIKIEVAGIVLNHEMTPQTYSEGNRPRKWLRSILEINTPEWSIDQSNRTYEKKYLDRAGGFFGAYVIFNFLLLIFLTITEKYEHKVFESHNSSHAAIALVTILLASLYTANFPQSHELRYLMFWMITLVSLNLHLIFSLQNLVLKWIKLRNFKLIYLLFFIVVCIRIEHFYLKPDFRSLEVYLHKIVNLEILGQITPNETNCITKKSAAIQHIFYYSSYFHPEINYDYSIKAAADIEACGTDRIIVPK
ncbi:MAG: hypothetical protein AAGF83_15765 [Cyanobacteria bacterium P01_G01_bin.67]